MRYVCASGSWGGHVYVCNPAPPYIAEDGEIRDIERPIGDGDPLDCAVVVRRSIDGKSILPC